MNIRTKITLVHSLIIFGFLSSMAFIVLRFNNMHSLKTLELESVNALTELKALELKTILFSKRNQTLSLLLEDWIDSIRLFDYFYTKMLNNPAHKLLGKGESITRDELVSEWDFIKNHELNPLIGELEIAFDLSGEIRNLVGRTTINISRELIAEEFGSDSTMYLALSEIENKLARQRELLNLDVLASAEVFISELRLKISEYMISLLYTTIAIALFFQIAGSFFALHLSRNIRRNVAKMGDTLGEVASGNFDTKLDTHSGDEFENIAQNFNLLTQELWTRIESMKDMMLEVGNAVEHVNAAEEMEELMLRLAVKNTYADAGIFMGIDNGELYPKHTQGNFPPLTLTEHRILDPVTISGHPFFIRKNAEELPENADSNSQSFISSAIFIPLSSTKTMGVLALVHTKAGSFFNDLDYAYMCSYGDFISLTLDNLDRYIQLMNARKVEREISLAAGIQKSLLPEKMPVLQGVEIAAFSDAVKGIGGDFYDVFAIGGGKTAIIICDVAGKGVSASLVMVMIRTIIRSISSPEKRADRIMIELNRTISGSVGIDKFATTAIIILDSKNGIVSYSNAAHLPLYIFRGNIRRYRVFDTKGLPLGIDDNASFGHKKIKINKNDYLIMFTDGLSEVRSKKGAELGTPALLKFVARHADSSSPNELVQLVKSLVSEHSGGHEHDDQTFLALRVV